VLGTLTAGGRHQALLDRALRALESWLVANQAALTEKFGAASRYTPRVFDRYIVSKFVAGIIALAHEVAQKPDHDIRRRRSSRSCSRTSSARSSTRSCGRTCARK
jgi:hypothetical protein